MSKKIIPNGTKVLIFSYQKGESLNDNEFIMGTVLSSSKSHDLSTHGSPWYSTIYKILGEDGKIYTGEYRTAFIFNTIIKTIDEHISTLKYQIISNNNEIKQLNNENNKLYQNLSLLLAASKENPSLTNLNNPNSQEIILEYQNGYSKNNSLIRTKN